MLQYNVPIYGIDILKSVSYNQGLFSSTDAYFIAIALALYRLYGVNVWRDMKTFYYRNEYGGPGCENAEYLRNLKNYNKLDFQQFPRDYNPVIWDIIESHAKNIYLNMKEDGQI